MTIPNNLTKIGEKVFSYCSGLTSVTIPNSVVSIGENAFEYCRGLTSVTIPNSVKSIGSSAFQGCKGLTSLTISNSLTKISEKVFYACSGLTSVTIPNSVTTIGDNAFYECSGLTSVTIPNSVTTIGENAFANCSGLTSVTIPKSVTSIGNSAFSGCVLTSVTLHCSTIDSWFSGFSSITNVIIGDEVTSIGQSAFSGCSGLTSVTIPNSVTTIGNSAFKGCSGLTSVTLHCSTIGSWFSGLSSITDVILGDEVTSIGEYAFYNCSSLTSVVIGSSVTSIGYQAFYGTNLKKTIWLTNTPPSGYSNASGAVNYVSNDRFSSSSNWVKYQFLSSYFDVDGIRYVPVSPSEKTCDAIDCVYGESSANMKIASTVTYKGVTMTVKSIKPYLAHNNKFIKTLEIDIDGEITNYAFTNCSNMKSVILGNKVSAIGSHAFQGCSSLDAIDIPDIVIALNDYTFADCTSLKEIEIKPKMIDIKYSVFDNCTSLSKVIIADSEAELNLGSNKKSSYNYSEPLFSSCPLDTVYIGRNINYNATIDYGYSPFYRNSTLRAVKITDKETEISENEFYGCTNLQKITIGDGVTTIGKRAFSGCSSLLYFAFGTQVAEIREEAFSDCAAMVEVISKAQNPPVCGSQALDDINKFECKLYVPDGYMAVYEAADQWKDFFFKDEGEGTASEGESGEQTVNKCETPTISFDGDKLSFACATEGVVYHYTISHSDVQNGASSKDVNLTQTYTIAVFARKDGYIDSKVAKATLKASGSVLVGDVDGNGIVNVADHVKLSEIIMNK